MKSHEGSVQVKAYCTKEMAALYGISSKTFRTWIHPIQQIVGPKTGHYFTALQVRIIFDKPGRSGDDTLLFLPLFSPLFESHEFMPFGIIKGMAQV